MIKTVVFDLGNVLLRFDPKEYLEERWGSLELAQKLFQDIILSPEWPMLDRGVISEEDAFDCMAARSPQRAEYIQSFCQKWYHILTPMPVTVNILAQLKERGYQLLFLSNFHQQAFVEMQRCHNFLQLFDGGVVSWQEKLLKPEPAIYRRLAEKYALLPCQTLFIDDLTVNVAAAEEEGFQTVLFTSGQELQEKLQQLKLLP